MKKPKDYNPTEWEAYLSFQIDGILKQIKDINTSLRGLGTQLTINDISNDILGLDEVKNDKGNK